MKWIIKGVREGLGRLIILIDFIFSPKKQQRTESDQEKINEEVKSIKLYQFYACPFCIKTRRAIKDSIYQLRPEMHNLANTGQNFLQVVVR